MFKRNLATLAGAAGTALALCASSALAAGVAADYTLATTAGGDEGIVSAFNIYDLAVGATLIKALTTNIGTIAAPVVGDKFKGYYQSYVTSHQLDGVVQSSPGLNTSGAGAGYELTVVAEFEEIVDSVGPLSYTSSIAGGTASLYFDTTPDYDFIGDTGFMDDELILSGSIVSGGSVSVPLLASGFAHLDIAVTSMNAAIFTPDFLAASGIFTLDLRSSAINGVTSVSGFAIAPGDLLLGADGNLELQPVPVPPAIWLLGSALTGMASIRRRRTA